MDGYTMQNWHISKLAIASFIIGAFFPAAYLLLSIISRSPLVLLIGCIPFDGNFFPFTIAIMVPMVGVVLGVFAKRRCLYGTLTGERWAHAGIILSIVTAVMLTNSFYILSNTHVTSDTAHCACNQRLLFFSFTEYAQDHNMTLPQNWPDADLPSPRHTKCPSYRGEGRGIGYNTALASRNMNRISRPDEIALLADSTSVDGIIRSRYDIDENRHQQNPPHKFYWRTSACSNEFIACFLDGHVAMLQSGKKFRLQP